MNRFGWCIAILALSACVEEPVDGRRAYQQDCAGCHGVDGQGAGDFGAMLVKVPPDLTTLSLRNGGIFPRDYVMSTIDGLHRPEDFSAAMPEFGAGDMGEILMIETTPVPSRLWALADYLESIQKDG